MTDYTPTWEQIAEAFIAVLKAVPSIHDASNGYPSVTAISGSSLPYVVIREPDVGIIPFTFGAVSLQYTGQLNVLVETINPDSPSLGSDLINRCTAIGINLAVELYQKESRRLAIEGVSQVTHAQLNSIEIGRFNPYSDTNKYSYAGLAIPYQIEMQYRSNV